MISTIFLVTVGMCALVICMLLYGLHRFRSLRRMHPISRRYPNLVQLECVACCLYLLLAVPAWSYQAFNDTTTHLSESTQLVWTLSARILNMTLAHFIVDIEATRLWLIHYDLSYLHSSKNQKWKVLIDPSFAEKNWYLRNRDRFGNKRYIFTRAVLYFIFETSATVTIYAYTQTSNIQYLKFANLVDAVLFIAPLVLINTTYWKSPKELDDELYFHFEYRTSAIMMTCGFALYVAAVIAGALISVQLEYILVVIAMIVAVALPSMISTFLIPFKILSSSQWVCCFVVLFVL